MRAGRGGPIGHLEGDAFFLDPALLLLSENRTANEIPFLQRNEEPDASFQRSGDFVQFMPVERVTDFGPKGITRSQSGGLQTARVTFGQQARPDLFDQVVGGNHLKPVFPRIAGAAYLDW